MLSKIRGIFRCDTICENFRLSAMEKAESSIDGSVADLEDRDPNNLNRHIQVTWDDIIGEPEGIRSPECAWRLSGHCFRLSRGFWYILLSVLIAPLIALCLGITFACLTFTQVWCCVPFVRIFRILFAPIRVFITIIIQAVLRPIFESIGYLCYNIRIFNQRLPDGPDRKDDMILI
ncbi:caveolin-3-like isoform X1 [Leptopilina heterotoma]|uniref:caveolin-3-like isoform X1 n=2 Tax=Leptopilina heterotoma TaxID=63436 RepID=UPI001CA92090|nr:caveolin-3-like isoform X1 [Leptopilina heterotoma]